MSEHAWVDAPTSPAAPAATAGPAMTAVAVGEVSTTTRTVTLHRLDDSVIDRVGPHVTSLYVETFWLPVLGPTCIWLLRLAERQTLAGPYVADVETLGKRLGVGGGLTNNTPLMRSLNRLRAFGAAVRRGDDEWRIRTHLAQLNERKIRQLPDALQQEHALFVSEHKAS